MDVGNRSFQRMEDGDILGFQPSWRRAGLDRDNLTDSQFAGGRGFAVVADGDGVVEMNLDAINADRRKATDDADDADRTGVDQRRTGTANATTTRGQPGAADTTVAQLMPRSTNAPGAWLMSCAADASSAWFFSHRMVEFGALRIDADRRRPGWYLKQQGEEGGKETAFHRSGSLAWRCSSAL